MIQAIIVAIAVIAAVLFLLRKKRGCKDKGCDGCALKEECKKKL